MVAAPVRLGRTALLSLVVAANVAVGALAITARAPLAVGAVVALALALPVLAALVHRPQRGLLLLVAIAPFNGLLISHHAPSGLSGWKEALALVTLAATFLAPAEARGQPGRRLPGWVPAVAALVALGAISG